MSTAIICRPSCDRHFTSLPNTLFNFGNHYSGLKPRDVAVLNYLLSKPTNKPWTLNRQAIANAVCMGVSTVSKALQALQAVGFASYQRFADGRTQWTIKIPVISPPIKKPDAVKPQQVLCTALETNEKAVINKTTTSVELPTQLTSDEARLARVALGKIADEKMQLAIVLILKTALAKGGIKSPLAYLNSLIMKARQGELSVVVPSNPVDKKAREEAIIRGLIGRKKLAIQADIEKWGFIHVAGLGNFTRADLKLYGLFY
ncbi:hypothetical protein BCS42_14880 [Crenothrix sp. D3]|nr:hypothetical protein BCS42_14880 [Crenothrix sp. D3]